MASYDALRHVSLGQYLPTGSVVHRLDPRAKLVALLLLVGAVVAASTYLPNLFLLAVTLALVRLARLPIRYILAGIKPALPIILVLSLMQLLFYSNPGGPSGVLLTLGPVIITTAGVRIVIVSLIRFVVLLFLTSLLTNTTTTNALTHGVESLLRPFTALGLPGHEIAMVCAIALRFVPILGEQLESIMQAHASRTVQDTQRSRWRLVENTRRQAALVVPLFVDAFRRTDEMALAMRARCYQGGRGRTRYVALSLGPADFLAMGLAALTLGGVILAASLNLP
ncbi:MAG: energy-coupling factor transporter transmembrane component T family protein [Anaerolineae bacterium]